MFALKDKIVKFIVKLTAPFKCWYFYVLLSLCLVDNLLGVCSPILAGTLGTQPLYTINIIGLCVLICYCESLFILLVQKVIKRYFLKSNIWWNPFLYLFFVINSVLLICDLFVFVNFGRVLDTGMLDIITQTNSQESKEFLDAYVNVMSILLSVGAIIGCIAVGWALYYLYRKCSAIYLYILGGFIFWGVCLSGIAVYKFCFFRNAQNIPQITSMTRVAYYGHIIYNDIKGLENLCVIADKYLDERSQSINPKKGKGVNIILVIGESHSKFHSPLYGYDKNTNPNMIEHMKDSSLIVFEDVVTIEDHTSAVMNSIYSVGRYNDDLYNLPLLPMIFKREGYYTALYDNQYLVGVGQGILSHKRLSEKMFDFRNSETYTYDGEMIPEIEIPNDRDSFVIVHLYGQHYTYINRYPKEFSKFKPSQYTGDETQRIIKSEYDNACLYNDHVLEMILTKMSDKDVCVIYLSDHGEDMFEQPGVFGHGFAAYAPSLKYQIRIPMFVWGSEKFRSNNPALWERIKNAASLPMSSDDMSHFIMDLAEFNVPELDETRSSLNRKYDTGHPRMVLHSIKYTETK